MTGKVLAGEGLVSTLWFWVCKPDLDRVTIQCIYLDPEVVIGEPSLGP